MGKKGKDLKEEKGKVINDPRFSAMHTMPIFKKMNRDEHKVKLDDGFKSVLTDERFQITPGNIY